MRNNLRNTMVTQPASDIVTMLESHCIHVSGSVIPLQHRTDVIMLPDHNVIFQCQYNIATTSAPYITHNAPTSGSQMSDTILYHTNVDVVIAGIR